MEFKNYRCKEGLELVEIMRAYGQLLAESDYLTVLAHILYRKENEFHFKLFCIDYSTSGFNDFIKDIDEFCSTNDFEFIGICTTNKYTLSYYIDKYKDQYPNLKLFNHIPGPEILGI